MAVNFGILFQLPWQCIKFGLMVTPFVFIYPTTKRYFAYPQLVLGSVFNSGVCIGYCALAETVAWNVCLPFYLGGVLWTIFYDSVYAFQDRTDDKKLGLKSTAIAMEHAPKETLFTLAAASTALFALGGFNAGLTLPFYLGLIGVGSHYTWQLRKLNIEDR